MHSTIYQPDVLLMAPAAASSPEPPPAADGRADDAAGRSAASRADVSQPPRNRLQQLDDVARRLGWTVEEVPLKDPASPREGEIARPALPSVARTVRVRISLAPDADPEQPLRRPDAWRLLGEARRAGISGLSLNHVMSVDALGLNPFTGTPFTGTPFTGTPFTGTPFTGTPFTGTSGGTAAYALPGMGGRQPVVYTGPVPTRRAYAKSKRRPVVAILDTGCGQHPWLDDGVVIDASGVYGGTIGIDDPDTDPEYFSTLGDPLDGVMDHASGHGTFIAGVVLQACPDVQVLPVRVSSSQGVILENDLTDALGQIVGILEDKKKRRIDVINLSFSFYHESPDSQSDDGELYALLKRIRAQGCVVVCSAGNDATDRPSSPASLFAFDGGPIDEASEKDLAPHVTVGALNPSCRSVAMFSNVGDWVQTYARGVALLSLMPERFDGGMQADLRFDLYGRRRETLDLDDFRAGFAVWSGTSFSAPLVAGRIAAALAPAIMKGQSVSMSRSDLKGVVTSVIAAVDAQDLSKTT